MHPFFTFHGNCREAMQFYRSCFGGTLSMIEIGQSEHAHKLPESVRKLVLHARLECDMFVMLASDLGQRSGTGNGRISLLIECDQRESKRLLSKLSDNKIQETSDSNTSVIDKFGVEWILSHK
nr:VOC family protein [Flavobacterium sp.]